METKMKIKTNTFAADEVNRLELRLAAADVEIKEAVGREIRVEAENLSEERYRCELRDGVLVVHYQFKNALINLPNQQTVHITLYIPSGMFFESIVLEAGAGKVGMEEVPLSCQKLNAEIGAGKWKAARLSVQKRLSVEIGAGKVKMKDVTAGSLSVHCGVGESVYRGRVNGELKVSCGVGSCKFQLENKECDFDYKLSCALGNIRLNGNKSGCLGNQKISSNGKVLGKAVLECGLGSIELDTLLSE
ncbi:MAG: DUF4097 domain-containing protein [Lachnospiraceae bacterium]|nr:DUF4097 domain-containing protein [Lachnospiraceae bacterium]